MKNTKMDNKITINHHKNNKISTQSKLIKYTSI